MIRPMQLRPMTASDLEQLPEIDATVESSDYLHLGREGEGLTTLWRLEQRPLREKLIEPHRLAEEARFAYKQVVRGIEEGTALAVEMEGRPAAAMLALPRPQFGTIELVDVRVDYDYRRQGFATAMLYQLIGEARQRKGVRAIYAEVRANNTPAQELLARVGFELSGFDERRRSNHDLVKETTTLMWYLELEG